MKHTLLFSFVFMGCVALLASCGGSVKSVEIIGTDVNFHLRERPNHSRAEEGRLFVSEKGSVTPRYYIKGDTSFFSGRDFLVDYISPGIDLSLEAGDSAFGTKETFALPLPHTPESWETTVRLPITMERLLPWFRIGAGKAPAYSSFLLRGVGSADPAEHLLAVRFPDFEKETSQRWEASLYPTCRVDTGGAEPGQWNLEFYIGQDGSSLYRHELELDYRFDATLEMPGQAVIRIFRNEGEFRADYTITLRPGEHELFFLPDFPLSGDLRIELEGEKGLTPQALRINRRALWTDSRWSPMPADMGEVLDRSASTWRRSDFELYSWNLFPQLLIFDYRDYAVQSAMLKRLAFFVEKKGSAGELLPNEALEKRHGWNAHDYRSEDLARFFTEAQRQKFPLNDEEYMLRDILEENIIIAPDEAGGWKGVDGGFLSLSRESSDRLRYLFLVHEGYHGLFFSSKPFRDRVFSYWDTLSTEEQDFWRIFLDWKRYNVLQDNYLLVNEFMAYLMQQDRSRVDSYFFNHTIPTLIAAKPEERERLELFVSQHPDHFRRSAAAIESAAFETAGVLAGNLFDTRRVERE
jgi:hypothetical protein